MMEERKSVFAYIGQVFATFGIIVSIFIAFCLLIGESTGRYSTLFELGGKGLTAATLLELLLLSAVITIGQILFLTDRWIKNMSIVCRNVLFFLTVLGSIVAMIVLFGWFPVNDIRAWAGFAVSFVLSMGIGILVSRMKERAENDRMQAALDRYQKGRTGSGETGEA